MSTGSKISAIANSVDSNARNNNESAAFHKITNEWRGVREGGRLRHIAAVRSTAGFDDILNVDLL